MLTLLLALLPAPALAAYHAPVITCRAGAEDPEATVVTLQNLGRSVVLVNVTAKGEAPRRFAVLGQHLDPSTARYAKPEEGFELTLIFRVGSGSLHGTYAPTRNGQRVELPVTCEAEAAGQ